MKKENRQMAQERRTQERKRKEQKEKTKKFLMIGLPVLVVVLFIAVIIVDAVQNSNTTGETASAAKSSVSNETTSKVENSVTDENENAGSVIEAEETTYQTDPSLTVENGDTVNIDYVGSVDGVEFSGGNTQGMGTDLVIGSGLYIDDFEEQLIGAHPGDHVTVTVTFPEDYGKEDLNGKEAVFEVTVNGIYD